MAISLYRFQHIPAPPGRHLAETFLYPKRVRYIARGPTGRKSRNLFTITCIQRHRRGVPVGISQMFSTGKPELRGKMKKV